MIIIFLRPRLPAGLLHAVSQILGPCPRFGAVSQGSPRNPNTPLVGDQLHESTCPVYNLPIA
jgi:hypothetical protein